MTIQDISCIGKCSLTVALPIISAMGIECAIVPTAVLSTHTMFDGFTFRDLTDDLDSIREHWLKEEFSFDAIYTGYLGSIRQIEIVQRFFSSFKRPDNYIIVDPAMADNGKMYAGFDKDFALKMTELSAYADIILPNISEAAFMLDIEYPGENASIETIKEMLLKLSKLGSKKVVITGVKLEDDTFGFVGYDNETKSFFKYGTRQIPMRSHGTGDVFASSFTGALTRGFDIFTALKIAADYTSECINNSYKDPNHVNYAVNFEAEIPYLLESLKRFSQ